jgi:hypoxanthine phosphoribosyltransferase
MKKIVLMFLLIASICYADDNLELLISREEISQKIQEVAAQIDAEYEGKDLAIIMIMKGSLCVAADFIRQLHVPFTLEYMKASSYGQNGMTSGELKITGLENFDFTSKDVLIIDDIFDTGKTMATIVQHLKSKNPKSLKTLVLLLKKNPRQITYYRPDYALFEIEDRFVVGFGLDYKEYYRGLPGVYAFINDTPPETVGNAQ